MEGKSFRHATGPNHIHHDCWKANYCYKEWSRRPCPHVRLYSATYTNCAGTSEECIVALHGGYQSNDVLCLSVKLHYTDTGYGHVVHATTPTDDDLTTTLQLVVQQIHHQRTKICHIPKSWHVEVCDNVYVIKW